MPVTTIDTGDAAELAELLQLIAEWLASDPAPLGASLLKFIGHPAYGTQELQDDLHRFAFLLGCTDGEGLFGTPEEPLPALPHEETGPAPALSGRKLPARLRRHATSRQAPATPSQQTRVGPKHLRINPPNRRHVGPEDLLNDQGGARRHCPSGAQTPSWNQAR